MVAGRRGADDADAVVLGELDEDAADAAVGAEHQDRLAGLHVRGAVQHLPRGDAVHDHRLRVLGADPVGTTTLSRAATTTCAAHAPVLVIVATRGRPAARHLPGPTERTGRPGRSPG